MLLYYIELFALLELWQNKLLWINQVYYFNIFYKTHKHNNYLQYILKQRVCTKVITIAKLEGLGRETKLSAKSGGGVQGLKVRVA